MSATTQNESEVETKTKYREEDDDELSDSLKTKIRHNIKNLVDLPAPPETFKHRDHDLTFSQLRQLRHEGAIIREEKEFDDGGYFCIWKLDSNVADYIDECAEKQEGGYDCCRFRYGFGTVNLDSEYPYECKGCETRHNREKTMELDLPL